MLRRTLHLLAFVTMLAVNLPAVYLKVLSVNHKRGEITVFLPMHNAQLKAELPPGEPEIRVRPDKFYKAEFEAGKINTVKRNVLRIDVPDQRPVRVRILRITFIER